MSNSLDPDQYRHFVGPDWVQIVCKIYQQTTQVAKVLTLRIVRCIHLCEYDCYATLLFHILLALLEL